MIKEFTSFNGGCEGPTLKTELICSFKGLDGHQIYIFKSLENLNVGFAHIEAGKIYMYRDVYGLAEGVKEITPEEAEKIKYEIKGG